MEAGGGVWRRDQKVAVAESPRYAGGGPEPTEKDGDGDGNDAGTEQQQREMLRNTSYMPRHHKSEVCM